MRKRDLVVVCFGEVPEGIPDPGFDVTRYTIIKRPHQVNGLEVNTRKETWTYQGQTHKIGSNREITTETARTGPIGVYNPKSINHLNRINMLTLKIHG
tara:strand:+ start:253 stop:546 length:294 start_codon:yes stop_codon:yes gene_type:complete